MIFERIAIKKLNALLESGYAITKIELLTETEIPALLSIEVRKGEVDIGVIDSFGRVTWQDERQT